MAATLMEILAVGERDHVLNRAGDLAAALFDWSQRLQAAIAARDAVSRSASRFWSIRATAISASAVRNE